MAEQEQKGSAVGSGIGKVAGAIFRQGLKKIGFGAVAAVLGGPIAWFGGGCLAVVFLVLFPIFIVLLFLAGAGGGFDFGVTPVEAAPSSGDGTGLVADYCLKVAGRPPPYPDDPNTPENEARCSEELRKLFLAAGAWAKVPAAVIAGIATREGPQIFSYTDEEILQYSAPGGEDPYNNSSPNDSSIDDCNVSWAGAMGPMQFMPGTWDGSGGRYKEAVNIATNEGRDPDVCNIKDAIYAAAWKLKCDVTPSEQVQECYDGKFTKYDYNDDDNWWEGPPGEEGEEDGSPGEVYQAAAGYYWGDTTRASDCEHLLDDGTPYSYCQAVWEYYLATADGRGGGDWPNSGYISQGPYSTGSHQGESASSIDIDGEEGVTPVYAIRSGNISQRDKDSTGALVLGIEVGKYIYYYVHFHSYSPCVKDLPVGSFIPEGQFLGYVGMTGSQANHPHNHYMIWDGPKHPISEQEFRSLLPDPDVKVGDTVTTSFSGEECIP
ncbi:MAG: hypothetical protein A2126_04245 [Candidatus Woykebacteria bacterium GWB1_45_5]|uniref:M23ase beta-sheet core domain-containing protein n=2 Tax=Candidatus Woykeibacteriota TaxID=1817899 RepID=A0A1G1W1Q5_9BACT|nr:MAG: hypothetical protein A2113_02050 [Candidatus Woykebacteria bacterium GWA1_44_8]OGY22352.1 MAG: hypothetical protein A2126_04245 [Candidatus Woykebacteria bacterium GWB1_45_5]